MDLNEIIEAEELHLKKLHEVVLNSINEEDLLSKKLLELESDENLSYSQKLADTIADFGGSWKFILVFLAALIFWIIYNYSILNNTGFDPYPFILLNLILSCIAAIQAPLIMMSQNRQEDKDRRRSRSDYLVNMKAEMEIRTLHQKVDLLMAEQMQHLFKVQQAQLEILSKLELKVLGKNDL